MSEIRLIDSASEIFLPLGSDRVYSDGDQLPPERHLAAAFRHRLQPAR